MKRLRPLAVAVVVSACATPSTTTSITPGTTSDPAEAARIAAVFEGDRKKRATLRGSIAVDGAFDDESVRRTIAQYDDSVRACVERGAKVGSVPAGRQVLVLAIEPTGRVSKARVKGPAAKSVVGTCLREAAKRWRFGSFRGKPARVEVPLVLRADT